MRKECWSAIESARDRRFAFGFWLYKITQRNWFKKKKPYVEHSISPSEVEKRIWVWFEYLTNLWSRYVERPVTVPLVTNWSQFAWNFPGFSIKSSTSWEPSQSWANQDIWLLQVYLSFPSKMGIITSSGSSCLYCEEQMRWQMLKCFGVTCGQVAGLEVPQKPHLFVLAHALPGTLGHCVEPIHHTSLWHMLFSANPPARPRQNASGLPFCPTVLAYPRIVSSSRYYPLAGSSNQRSSLMEPSTIVNKAFWWIFFEWRSFIFLKYSCITTIYVVLPKPPEAAY